MPTLSTKDDPVPIQLEYQTPVLHKPGPIFWSTARASVCVILGVLLPLTCFLFCTLNWPLGVDSNSDAFTAIAHLLMSGRCSLPLLPALLCPIIAMTACCLTYSKALDIWIIRQGIYAGVLNSILIGMLYTYDIHSDYLTPDSTPVQNAIALSTGVIVITGLVVSALYFTEKLTINRIAKPLWITFRIMLILFCVALVLPGAPFVFFASPAFVLFAYIWMAIPCWQTAPTPAPVSHMRIAWISYLLLLGLGWAGTVYNALAAYKDLPLR
jgi:hypothetical protein